MRTLALALSVAALAAAPALAAERQFDVTGFSEVVVSDGLTVEIAEGAGFSVIGEGAPRDLRRLEVHRRGDALVIGQEARGLDRFSPLMWALADEVVVRVALPELRGVDARVGSDVTVAGSAPGAFSAEVSTGADLEMAGVEARTVSLSASSGGSLDVAGTCEGLIIVAGSGADVEARALACDSATARASAGARIEITAGAVRAEVQSGADVEVWGAQTVEADERSGGDVRVHE